jgi:hypothetical protein
MEVFYRTGNGQLAHLTTSNSGLNWAPEVVLPANAIQ